MSYTEFVTRIRHRFGNPCTFSTDTGNHSAIFEDEGVTILGNIRSHKVTVLWGSGHCAMATI